MSELRPGNIFEAVETELTKEFEKETGFYSKTECDVWIFYTCDYVAWLEKKIQAVRDINSQGHCQIR